VRGEKWISSISLDFPPGFVFHKKYDPNNQKDQDHTTSDASANHGGH
jgi:hypothetical protein